MEEMLLQELMHLIVVMESSTAFLKMLNPVETCILNFWRKTLFYLTALHFGYKHTRTIQVAYVLLKRGRHKPYTLIGQFLVCLLFVHPKLFVLASIIVKEEVAKRSVVETKRVGLIFRNG